MPVLKTHRNITFRVSEGDILSQKLVVLLIEEESSTNNICIRNVTLRHSKNKFIFSIIKTDSVRTLHINRYANYFSNENIVNNRLSDIISLPPNYRSRFLKRIAEQLNSGEIEIVKKTLRQNSEKEQVFGDFEELPLLQKIALLKKYKNNGDAFKDSIIDKAKKDFLNQFTYNKEKLTLLIRDLENKVIHRKPLNF